VTTVQGSDSGWFRELIRKRRDPDEQDTRRAAVNRRLFGTPAEDVDPDDDGPAAA